MFDDASELSAYLDGELSPDARRKVELRLANEAAYAQELRALERVHTMIATAIETPATGHETTARIQEESRRLRKRRRTLQVAAVALVVLVLGLAVLSVQFMPQGPTKAEQALHAPIVEETDSEGPPQLANAPAPPAPELEAVPQQADVAANLQLLGTITGGQPSAILTVSGETGSFAVGDELLPGVTLQEVNRASVTVSDHGEPRVIKITRTPTTDYAEKFNGLWQVFADGESEAMLYNLDRTDDQLVATPVDDDNPTLAMRFEAVGSQVTLWTAEDVVYKGNFDAQGDALALSQVGEESELPMDMLLRRVPGEVDKDTLALAAARSDAEQDLKQMYQLLLNYANDHEGRFPPQVDALAPDYTDDLSLFADTEDRKLQYVAGLKLPNDGYLRRETTRPEEPRPEPLANYPDRLMDYEQELIRAGHRDFIFAKCLVRLHYPDLQLTAEVDTMGRVATYEANGQLANEKAAELRAQDQNNLKQLGLVIKIYENEHHGYTPPGWLATYPAYLTDVSVLTSPKDKPGTDSYDYLLPATHLDGLVAESGIAEDDPRARAQAMSEIPLVINKSDWPDGGRNILFVDGHVEYVQDWRSRLQNLP